MKFEYETFLKVYRDHQDKDNTFFYEHFPNADKSTIRSYKSRAKKNKVSKIVSPKVSKLPKSTNKKDPPQEKISFIDDPNELLLSVAIRELNKPNPDPRWASILINCKKEKITNTNEVIDQFKNLPTAALVNLLNKSSQEEY